MWQKKCLKGERAGGGEGRDMVRAAEEGHIKVEGQGWRKDDKDLRELERGTGGMNSLSYNTH